MLSIAINVRNGGKYLERCLNALTKFADVVLLDNHSTDNTLEIARGFSNVRIFHSEFLGMGRVRNLAASYTKNDWVLFVDCDEIVSPELANQLLNMNFEKNYIYRIYRKNFYDGYQVETSSWGNDWILRLYNKTDTQFIENEVHDSFIMDNMQTRKIVDGFIYHFPYDAVSQLVDKMQFYSTLYAKQHFGKKKPKLYSLPLRAFIMFFKCYILKRGFLDGYEGLIISSYNAMGVFSKYIKLYELTYKINIALAININNLTQIDKLITQINLQTMLPFEVYFFVDSNFSDIAVLENKLKALLVVKATVMRLVNVDLTEVPKGLIHGNPQLNNIVLVNSDRVLDNKNLMRKCKKAVLSGKQIRDVSIY